ncbi:hypothetical protein [Nocardia sp. N2S4-5]
MSTLEQLILHHLSIVSGRYSAGRARMGGVVACIDAAYLLSTEGGAWTGP